MTIPDNPVPRDPITFSTKANDVERGVKAHEPGRLRVGAQLPARRTIMIGLIIVLAVCLSATVVYNGAVRSNPMLMMSGMIALCGIGALVISPRPPRPAPRGIDTPSPYRRDSARSTSEAAVLHETFARGLHEQSAPESDAD